MTREELIAVLDSLKDFKNMRDQLDAEISDLESTIKKYMSDHEKEEEFVGQYKITYRDVFTERVDSKKLREKAPKTYERYLVHSSYKRLNVK